MGQRANYVVIEDGRWSLHYSHWSANTADRDLFWGPDLLASRASPPGGAAAVHVTLHGDDAVRGGAHIDPALRRVDVWETAYRQDLAADAARSSSPSHPRHSCSRS